MHQVHIANMTAHDGRRVAAMEKWQICKSGPEVKKEKPGSCSMPLT
jgi:hypothetical protein